MKDDDASFHTAITNNDKDHDLFRLNFRKDVQTVFNTILCNPFQIDSLSIVNDTPHTFPKSFVEIIKTVLSDRETQVKSFKSNRLILQKTPITKNIKKQIFFTET